MRILEEHETWIHTHFVTDAVRLPARRLREIERGLRPVLLRLGIVFGIHFERERDDPGVRIVLECRPAERERAEIRRELARLIRPIPRRPPSTRVRIEEPAASASPRAPRPRRVR